MSAEDDRSEPRPAGWPMFLAGLLAGGAGMVLLAELTRERSSLDPMLIRARRDDPHVPPTVIVPGILGSELLRPDGSRVWLNAGNAIGYHDLGLPVRLPLSEAADDLVPGGLLGVDSALPRLFGFTEYADLLRLLLSAGFHRDHRPSGRGAAFHVFTYDWRRDLIESVRRLDETLEQLADAWGEPGLRFNLVGHSLGGLIVRYYLRYGVAEPGPEAPVTWAGTRRVANSVLVASPNAGSVIALDAIVNGNRVGFSTTTLAPQVIAPMVSMYQLLPPRGAPALIDQGGRDVPVDLHDVATWERFGWGPYHPVDDLHPRPADPERARAYLAAALERARVFHEALSRTPDTLCPGRVVALGGDCLATLGRGVLPERPGQGPRLEPADQDETRIMYEAGDGRVTRASVLASHLAAHDPTAHHPDSGIPEVSHVFFGAADHHGIYQEPTFQSVLLRLLLRPDRPDSAPRLTPFRPPS